MIPIVASLLGTLAQNGLGLLSSAIQAKGKQVVENTLGVKIPDAPTPEDVSKLRQLQFEHEERLMELGIEKAKMELAEIDLLAKAAQSDADNVTDRWQADMSSDSWLSKNIRPMMSYGNFVGLFLFAMMSAFGYNANESYVNLLGWLGSCSLWAHTLVAEQLRKLAEMRGKNEPKQRTSCILAGCLQTDPIRHRTRF
jgi:hypothetical protein